MLHLGVTTVRRPECYVWRSLESLRAAGFGGPVALYAEPDHTPVEALAEFGPFELRAAPEPQGCFPNWRRALADLVDRSAPGDWVMVCQDDVVYRSDAAARLAEGMALHPEAGFLSPYCSAGMLGPRGTPLPEAAGWRAPVFYDNAFWGALCLALPRAAAAALLDFPRFRAHDHHRKVDVLVGNCFRDMGMAMYVHAPSLADHIGAYSTLGRHRIPGIQWGRRGAGYRPQP